MCNSFKTVKQILKETPKIESYLADADNYWAHRDANGVKLPEKLSEHIELVNRNLLRLVEAHQLDPIIDRLIERYLLDVKCTDRSVGNDVKQQYILSIVFHDHGKVNELFQGDDDKMDNALFKTVINGDSPLSTNHAQLSAFIYLAHELKYILKSVDSQKCEILLVTASLFSYVILKHHSATLNDEVEATLTMDSLFANKERDEVAKFMHTYLERFEIDLDAQVTKSMSNKSVVGRCLKESSRSTAMFGLIKLCYSLLTASDYLATNEYFSGCEITDFGVFPEERINQIYHNISIAPFMINNPDKINFNSQTFSELPYYKLQNPVEQSGENLNILRKEMGIEMLRNLRKNIDKNLFYIEAPTGGGKTNLSALAAMELLKSSQGRLNKVFYVFPFTTLITQTKASLINSLGLQNDEIVELHSRASFAEKKENDGLYGKDRLNYIANLFAHYPLCLLSHIAFFDVLKTNRKEKNYLFHRLANSVVIIDELQSYNPKHWDKIIYFIRYFADTFNIKFILMSATLPKLDKLAIQKDAGEEFTYLLNNARKDYFQNPNFCNRISFDFEYFERKDLTLTELSNRVLTESETYAGLDFGDAKPKGSVYTIIEFIFKKTATEFYNLLEKQHFFDEVFVLSGTILEHRRQYIINYLKDVGNRTKKILLITTQVVEAGVDIDMDLGFKDRSLIDSDEQLAGRINRNVNKKECKLFLFNYDKEPLIYGSDSRFKVTQKRINSNLYKEILQQKDFDKLYNLVINDRNKWNDTAFAVNFKDYEDHIKELRFESVHQEFKLIETKNISCYIPLELPLKIGEECFFSDKEIEFLEFYKVFPNANSKIDGEEVFNLYLDFINNRIDPLKQKIRGKILQNILSKYVISLFASPAVERDIIHFCDMEKSGFGYLYVERWRDFYSEEGGMDAFKFKGVEETQFL